MRQANGSVIDGTGGTDGRRAIGVAILACLGLAGWLAWTRGGWLDEFWTVWHSDPAIPFARAYWERWVHDTQHPPAFYALAWLLGPITGPGLGARRLAADLVGLALLAWPIRLSRVGDRAPGPVLLLLLLVLSGPYAVTYLAEHRSYALGLLAATALLVSVRTLHLAAMAGDRLGGGRAACLLATAAVAGNLHYTLAMVQLLLLGCLFLFHAWRGSRTAATLVAAAMLLIAVPLAGALAVAVRQQAPIVAIHVGLLAGWRTVVVMLALGFGANLALLAGAWPAVRRLVGRGADVRDARTSLLLILAAALGLATLAFLLLEVVARNMYPRLLLGLLPLAGLLVAELAAWNGLSRRVAMLAALNAVAVAGATVAFQRRDPRIDSFAPILAAAFRACPGTRIVAVDPLALTAPDDPLRRMTGQGDAVALGYRRTAARWRFPVRLWPGDGTVPPVGPTCPTLVWMEHGFMLPQGIAQEALLARLRLIPPAGARVTDRRERWHYLVTIDPGA